VGAHDKEPVLLRLLGRWRSRTVWSFIVRVLAVGAVTTGLVPQVVRADTASLAGTAGIDTSLPPTDSAVTLAGAGGFSSLKVTVNQTKHLLNQAISVTWTGATPTDDGLGQTGRVTFQSNFLQIFQCWGDDGTGKSPPPTQCEFGGVESVPGKFPSGVQDFAATGRQVAHNVTPATYRPSDGFLDGGVVYSPYVAADGTTVNEMFAPYTGPVFDGSPGRVWNNPYFDYYTTNEIDFGRTYGTKTGAELFQVYTGQQARGLGCGQKVVKHADGSLTIPKCWLVVVPRSTGTHENGADQALSSEPQVATSPLSPSAWNNRIVFPLDFNPADSPCSIGAVERRIVGNEMATAAVTSWQPTLCQTAGLPPYAYGSVSDDQARRILISGDSGAAGMAVVSNPLDPATVDPANPVVYAPITLSGITIGFNIERKGVDKNGTVVDPNENPLNGIRIAHINLTPRLVAKLLTESYGGQFLDILASKPKGYAWLKNNPDNLLQDPEFVQFNPEFRALSSNQLKDTGGLVIEESTSDAARQVWQWILADPEAKTWMAGSPDMTGCPTGATPTSCGIRVNPLYSTASVSNPSGVPFATPNPPNSFPKNDQYCFQAATSSETGMAIAPRPLCMQDVLPYSLGLEQAAQATRAANDQAKTTHIPAAGETPETWWSSDGPQIQGSRGIISITDTASAFRYGLQTASLSRAGDDTSGRTFVTPDQNSLTAGANAMTASAAPAVLQPNPAPSAAGAYPLTTLTYAAVTPRSLDSGSRTDYAAFVSYASTEGQTLGLNLGNLPPGYASLPASLATQAKSAVALIKSGNPAAAATATSPSTAASSTVSSGSKRAQQTNIGGGATSSPTASNSPVGPTPTRAPGRPTPQPDPLPLQIVHTMAQAVGAMRYTLPIALTIAMIAGVIGLVLDRKKRTTRPRSH
jgi:hypothetical protein